MSPDGAKVFVTGLSLGAFASEVDYATIAYNATTGAAIWARRYDGPGHSRDTPSGLSVSPDGKKVLVTGSSYGPGTRGEDWATLAYVA